MNFEPGGHKMPNTTNILDWDQIEYAVAQRVRVEGDILSKWVGVERETFAFCIDI